MTGTWRDRTRDPVWWNAVTQLVKTSLAAVLARVIATEVFSLPQSFLAPVGGAAGRARDRLPDLLPRPASGLGCSSRRRARLGGRQRARPGHGLGRGDRDGGPDHRLLQRDSMVLARLGTPSSVWWWGCWSTPRSGRRCDGVRRRHRGLDRPQPLAGRRPRPRLVAGAPGPAEQSDEFAALGPGAPRPSARAGPPPTHGAGGGRHPEHGPHLGYDSASRERWHPDFHERWPGPAPRCGSGDCRCRHGCHPVDPQPAQLLSTT